MRLLLIEDDATIAAFVSKGLKEAGFVVEHVNDGKVGLQMASSSSYDVAVIDIMLPGLDGLKIIEELRQQRIRLPVIILSAKRSVDERIEGLRAGGDDYLTKPFAFSELLARVQALIRRASGSPEPTGITVGDLSIDLLAHVVRRGGKKISLQPREFSLRLTLWYAGIFSLSSMLAFALVFALMATIVQQRTDQELLEDIEEYAAFMRIGGLDRVKSELMRDAQGADAQRVFFRLWAAGGRQLMTTDLSAWSGLGDPREILTRFDDVTEPILETRSLPQQEREVRIVYGAIAPGIILETGEPIEDNEKLLAALLKGILIAIAAVLVLGGPIGWFMARRALRGVQEVTRTAKEIANGALDRRVALRSQGDEIDVLAQTFNTMLDRIQALIIGMRQMSDNLAHDIRSPLARIRAGAEMAPLASPDR